MSSDKRSAQILQAAKQCFLAKGYFATKMDEIAKTAGLSKGGVYFHFDSKRDIFHALVQREYEAAISYVDSVVVGDDDLISKILLLGQHFTELFSTAEDNPRFMIIVHEMSLRDEDVRELLLQIQLNHVAKLEELLEWGVANGQLRDVDTRSIAFLLKSIIDGIQVAYSVGYEADLPSLLQAGIDLITNGMNRERDVDEET